MKRIATQQNSIQKRILINIPFVLLVLGMIVFFGGGLLMLFYSVVCGIAFKSAMISLIVLGIGFLSISAGLGFILLYKKYLSFYNNKMGWIYPSQQEIDASVKTSTPQAKTFKDYLTLSNVTMVIVALGAVLAIISSALGCTDRDKWVDGISTFRQYNGYYEDIHRESLKYQIKASTPDTSDVNEIQLNLIDKVAVVIYTNDDDKQDFVNISGYTKYVNHLVMARTKDGTITITENPSPKRNETLDTLLFFIFDDISVERQILIYIPKVYQDAITINGENVIYSVETPSAEN